jgi:hypothetical protein
LCAGTFSVGKKAGLPRGSRAFMSIYRAKHVLQITTNSRPALIGLEIAHLEAVLASLTA